MLKANKKYKRTHERTQFSFTIFSPHCTFCSNSGPTAKMTEMKDIFETWSSGGELGQIFVIFLTGKSLDW